MFGLNRSQYKNVRRVIVLAGAGMSADLGVPVYWSGDMATYGGGVTTYGYTPLQHAHATLYMSDPYAQSRYHLEQYRTLWSIDAASSHYADLLKFCAQREYMVVTTNIDAAFVHAGFDRQKVWEVHGSYSLWQCSQGNHGLWNANSYRTCPQCGAVARPNVLFFDDPWYVPSPHYLAARKAYAEFVGASDTGDTLVIEIGVGATVPRLAIEADTFLHHGFNVLRVNPAFSDDDEAYTEVIHKNASDFCKTLA